MGLFTLVHSYRDAQHEVQELFDAQLAQAARVLQALVLRQLNQNQPGGLQEFLEDAPFVLSEQREAPGAERAGHAYERKLAFQVWSRDRELLLHSSSAPREPLSAAPLDSQGGGFADAVLDGTLWRVFSLWDRDGAYLIEIGERYDIREELTHNISQRLITPSLLSLPVLAALIWIAVGRGLSPLGRAAAEVKRRAPEHLEPMDLGPVPEEVRPLVEALNELFVRLQAGFERERRFTGDAAHELRTPLAALKTQAQVALRASAAPQREQALRQVIAGVDRATHLLQQLMSLSQTEPGRVPLTSTLVDLSKLAEETLAELGPQALAKDLQLALDTEGGMKIYGEPVALGVLLRNLVDNAIRYTPVAGEVEAGVHRVGDEIVLSVCDTGPGIAASMRERVLDRFYRIPGSGESGCGLGLSIVRQIAEAHGAAFALHDAKQGTGLIAEVRFPAPPRLADRGLIPATPDGSASPRHTGAAGL